nr:MAG TPA: capsid protein [Cressdnaviricota sp.]
MVIKYAKRKYVAKAPKVTIATKKYVKRVMDKADEDKYYDFSLNIAGGTVSTSTTGSVTLMSGVQQGLTVGGRIGEVISPKSLAVRIVTASLGNVADYTSLRCIIFQDRQIRTSTLPTISDLLENVSTLSCLNHAGLNASRFNILIDHLFLLNQNTPTVGIDGSRSSLFKTFKLSGKICYTNPTTGTEKGNIYVALLSDSATINAPAFNIYSRLLYEDC